jgi:3',5'-nucleoside bisphosphate phosphatase
MVMSRVDLHVHSTASDGLRTPGRLVEMAVDASLSFVSITDHDTLDGLREGSQVAGNAGIGFVPGVELSVDLGFEGLTAHLLGYFPSADIDRLTDPSTSLGDAMVYVREGRQRRNPRILEKLRASGVYLLMDDVRHLADGEVVGRPHIAEAMLNAGYVSSMKEAFNRFLAKGRPAYAERDRLPVTRAMEVIREAGGLPVMAHPGYIPLDSDAMAAFFRRMADKGLAGIEVFYPTHSAGEIEFLLSVADELGLLVTGGTDYHGRETEAAPLGGVPDGFQVTEEMVRNFIDICLESRQEVSIGKTE